MKSTTIYRVIDIYHVNTPLDTPIVRGVGTGGAGGIGPPIQKYGGGLSMFCPPHEMCINKFYIY